MSIYLYYIMTNQIETLNEEVAESYLKMAITSQSPESRQTGRRAFLIWQHFNEQASNKLF